MKKSIFAICDEDKLYGGKIYEYIHGRLSESYEVVLFTDTEAAEKYMSCENVNILLISAVCRALLKGKVRAENVVVLTQYEVPGKHREDEIYKYRSAEKVLKAVMEYCSANDTKPVRRNAVKPLKVVGVYSPVKRAFQTTFSVTLGQILAKQGKTLYVNFECFSGFDLMMSKNTGADLMDLVYFWELGSENFSYRLESVIEHIGNLDYVPPVHSFRSFEGIKGEQWLGFIKAFEEYTDYEYLILDLSENVNGLFDVLRLCQKVYTVTDSRRISRAKLSQYDALLRECSYEDILDKTKQLEIPLFREIPDEYEMLPYSELSGFIKKELEFERELEAQTEDAG